MKFTLKSSDIKHLSHDTLELSWIRKHDVVESWHKYLLIAVEPTVATCRT